MNVSIYTTPFCPFCVRAKMLLEKKGIAFEEIDVSENHELRQELVQRTRRTTVPQIFIDEHSIGGFDELDALNRSGDLDRMIADPN